jgi:hypothetical protein
LKSIESPAEKDVRFNLKIDFHGEEIEVPLFASSPDVLT